MAFSSFQSQRNKCSTSAWFWDACLRSACLWRQKNMSSTPNPCLSWTLLWGRGSSHQTQPSCRWWWTGRRCLRKSSCRGSWALRTSTAGSSGIRVTGHLHPCINKDSPPGTSLSRLSPERWHHGTRGRSRWTGWSTRPLTNQSPLQVCSHPFTITKGKNCEQKLAKPHKTHLDQWE